ncbi:glycosyltransferase family 2 protein [Candidatus Pelagibacter communis]|uniref:glycosyltransferase family 2 protein n=1 Tax=Pelagibacter ubique TaxID=198252 RepID=UPI00094D074C|nr:glycosyltransferase family 2 protein [Candidatus Pelagibacter ubique]
MRYQPLVSILINNYNKQKYCVQALRSASFQSYKKVEIIFFDDCSDDESLKRIENLNKKLRKKIKIIKNKVRGNIYSFNQMAGIKKSIEKSKGKIICLMDSDDFFKKNKVKEIVNFFSNNPRQEILFDCPFIYKNKNDKKPSLENYFFRENKWPKFPPTSCISVRKNSLKKATKKIFVKKFDELWLDFRLATYFAINKNQFNLLKTNLTFYRNYQDSYDKRFKKYLNLQWWNRRSQAFDFILFLNSKKFKKNKYSFDFLLTKLIDKLNFIF